MTAQGRTVSEVTQHIYRHWFTKTGKTGSTYIGMYLVITGSPKQVVSLWLHSLTNFFRSPCCGQPSIRSSSSNINSSFKSQPCWTTNKDCHSTWLNEASGQLSEIQSIGRHSKQCSHSGFLVTLANCTLQFSRLINTFGRLSLTQIPMA